MPPPQPSVAITDANTGTELPQSSQARYSTDTNIPTPETPEPSGAPVDIERICARLEWLQRKRMFCITQQSRLDRAMQSQIANALGYKSSMPEADRIALFKQAGAIMKAVEADKPYARLPVGDPREENLWAMLPLIPVNALSRKAWDHMRDEAERELRQLAATLPVWPWVRDNAKGVGELGLARLVGEAPLIWYYTTHEKLWKRLGLAVINGERQQKKTDAVEALVHGYAPRRRAEAYSVLSDTMLRAQWRGDPDSDAGGYAIGPYGAVYAARKAHTLVRIQETADLAWNDRNKWTRKRCDNDARRVMGKEFLRDLWHVWRGLEARHPARFAARNAA